MCAVFATFSLLGLLFLSVVTVHPNTQRDAAILAVICVAVGSPSLLGTFLLRRRYVS
ncbi:membrane protein [Rhodopirellula europaea 6C]|uniref:Membrane protein n=1 Tax=Rhodopirellula europaea 6C TaxID=1263867 RepID=M2AG52_9BACT|nr:membrane protein [Rhodopirellula europaea 6C]